MAVREFNGTSDDLITGVGAASDMVYGTVAALVKFSTVTDFRDWAMLHTSGGSFIWTPVGLTNFSTLHMFSNGASSNSGINPGTTSWKLIVARKATGSSTPRFSVYDYGSSTWTHTAGSGALDNSSTTPGSDGQVRFSYQGVGDFFGGRIAARAFWSNALPWAADSSGDAAIEFAGLEDSATRWADANPSALWLFDQQSTTDPVLDLSIGGTADQLSISGTTVVTTDDPPGFSFSVAAASAELAGSFAAPVFSSDVSSVPPNAGELNGSFTQPIMDAAAQASVDVSIIGTFSIPAFTGTGGIPIPDRDILVTIGPGERLATSIAAGPPRISVVAGDFKRTEIGA